MSAPRNPPANACACKQINAVHRGCIGAVTECTIRCRQVDARGGKTCWEKSRARIEQIRVNHGGKNG